MSRCGGRVVCRRRESLLAGRLEPGELILDLGCGAGTDSLVAAQMVASEGRVMGIDMTPEMLARRVRRPARWGRTTFSSSRARPSGFRFTDATFDVVISNGVIDLIPDKDAVFSELYRVFSRAGGSRSPTSRSRSR